MRLELTRPNGHYPLKVARLPIPPLLHNIDCKTTLCPEQDSNLHVSQHSHLKRARLPFRHLGINRLLPLSGKRGSNSRPQPWQGCALPTELFPHIQRFISAFATRICVLQTKTKISKSGKRGSNSRPQPWQGCALPTELFPRVFRLTGAKVVLFF